MFRSWFEVTVLSCALVPVMLQDAAPRPKLAIITFRMLDSRTGKLLGGELRIYLNPNPSDHSRVTHTVVQTNGTSQSDVPADTVALSAYGTDKEAWAYANCDSNKDHPWKEHTYSVSEILEKGVVAPNHCTHRSATAAPGEFVFFVRPLTFWEKFKV